MATNWTQAVRQRLGKDFPPDQVLPDKQPSYVRSAVYLFGALTIASFAIIIVTGTVLAIFGPQWWHTNGIGHFFNSLHLWSVEAFFFFMVIHLWGMFYLGAWRDGRGRTWAFGVIAFVVSIGTAFTGYLSQSNFDSQWIAVSAKDAMNAIGIGGFFNVLNFGQMYGFHILVLPVLLVAAGRLSHRPGPLARCGAPVSGQRRSARTVPRRHDPGTVLPWRAHDPL